MSHRWHFFDPVLATDYELHINPRDLDGPSYDKTITYQNTTAPGGKTLVFEGQDATQTIGGSGAILLQAHYEVWVLWFQKRRQIRLTDDLGRVMWIYVTAFKPTRKRSREYPWRHEFTFQATILDWETGV